MPIPGLYRFFQPSILALILLHLWIAPFTKVEESFNIQATHDILKYGVPTDNALLKFKIRYDHMTFPGAVPRTFIGALVLSAVAKPVVWYGNLSPLTQQYLVRGVLGTFNALALLSYASGIKKAFGRPTAVWYLALQASQFHVLFYSSRTLPNMFAFALSTVALRFLLPAPTSTFSQTKRARLALYLLTLATIIFRSELALLLGSHCLYVLLKSPTVAARISLVRSIFLPAILSATIAGLVLTVSIDSYFWQSRKLLWPELAAFLSNIFPKDGALGASAWGTSPWHWYCTSAIPRLLLNPLLLVLIAFGLTTTLRSSILDLLVPNTIYVALYSVLSHKETRFVFSIVPPLTAAAALVSSYITTRRHRSTIYASLAFVLPVTTLITALISHAVLLPLSAHTYPGAHALLSLHAHTLNYQSQPHEHVHLTNLALQTGITRFLEHPPPTSPLIQLNGSPDGFRPAITSGSTHWHYDKTSNTSDLHSPQFWSKFDYAIVEDPHLAIGAWDVVDKIPGLSAEPPRLIPPDIGRGYLVLGDRSQRREKDGLSRLLNEVYGAPIAWCYGVVHDVLREGYGTPQHLVLGGGRGEQWSWTRGWWVHWGLGNRLYVLRRSENWAKIAV